MRYFPILVVSTAEVGGGKLCLCSPTYGIKLFQGPLPKEPWNAYSGSRLASVDFLLWSFRLVHIHESRPSIVPLNVDVVTLDKSLVCYSFEQSQHQCSHLTYVSQCNGWAWSLQHVEFCGDIKYSILFVLRFCRRIRNDHNILGYVEVVPNLVWSDVGNGRERVVFLLLINLFFPDSGGALLHTTARLQEYN